MSKDDSLQWPEMTHILSKFPFGLLTHGNINSHTFIVQTLFCVCVCVKWHLFIFYQKMRTQISSKKITLKMSHLGTGGPDWLKVSLLFVTASCLCEWRGAADQWEGSGEDATVIQEKTAHCFWDIGEVWPSLLPAPAARLSSTLKDPEPHWQVRRSWDSRSGTWHFIISSLWASDVVIFILVWLSSKRTVPFQESQHILFCFGNTSVL